MWFSMKDFLKEASRSCSDFWSRVIWGIPCRAFLPHEVQLIEAVRHFVDQEVRERIQQQLSCRFFIDRSNPRMNVIHVNQFPAETIIENPKYLDHLR
jgi:hypothetical protein